MFIFNLKHNFQYVTLKHPRKTFMTKDLPERSFTFSSFRNSDELVLGCWNSLKHFDVNGLDSQTSFLCIARQELKRNQSCGDKVKCSNEIDLLL